MPLLHEALDLIVTADNCPADHRHTCAAEWRHHTASSHTSEDRDESGRGGRAKCDDPGQRCQSG